VCVQQSGIKNQQKTGVLVTKQLQSTKEEEEKVLSF
jgi:hypothetical protein